MERGEMKTKGWKSQYQYDKLLGELDYSSLRFLESKYRKDLRYFRNSHDLNDQDNALKYKEMQQRYSMIIQELNNRDKNKEFFSKIVEMTPDGVVIVRSKDGQYKRYNVGYDENYEVITSRAIEE